MSKGMSYFRSLASSFVGTGDKDEISESETEGQSRNVLPNLSESDIENAPEDDSESEQKVTNENKYENEESVVYPQSQSLVESHEESEDEPIYSDSDSRTLLPSKSPSPVAKRKLIVDLDEVVVDEASVLLPKAKRAKRMTKKAMYSMENKEELEAIRVAFTGFFEEMDNFYEVMRKVSSSGEVLMTDECDALLVKCDKLINKM